jgi:3-oxoacid CoA-transferase subunit A
MKTTIPDADSAVDGLLRDGMLITLGGFGLCGISERLTNAIATSGVIGPAFGLNNDGIVGEDPDELLRFLCNADEIEKRPYSK